jgi:aspartate dehydrogenase
MISTPTLRVGLAGFSSVGRTIGDALDQGIPDLSLSAVAVRNAAKAQMHLDT